MRPRRLGVRVLAALFAVLAWVLLAPPSLGGQTSYVVTQGTSMAPDFRTGDLALVRTQGTYEVGDVIAYRSPTLGVTVLHRVISSDAQGFHTRGDNNTWTDPDVVPGDQVIGRLWLHAPRVGAFLGTGTALPVALLGAALTVGAARTTVRRRGRRPHRKVSLVQRAPRRPAASAWLTAATVLAVSGVALLLFSLRTPAVPDTPAAETVTHEVGLTYQAAGDPAVYQGGELVTGDPVFLSLNPLIEVRVRDRVSGATEAPPRALALHARLVGAGGWEYVVPLGQAASGTELASLLDLRVLQNVIDQASARTGVGDDSYQLELVPSLVAADPAHPTAPVDVPPVVFRMQMGGQLVLDGAGHRRAEPITRTATEQGPATVSPDRRVALAGTTVPVWLLRSGGAGTLLLGTALAGLGLLRWQRDPLSRLRQPLISVNGHDVPDGAVETASLDELFRLATRYDRPVLRADTGQGSVYLVEEAGTWYRCAGLGSSAPGRQDIEDEDPPTVVITGRRPHPR